MVAVRIIRDHAGRFAGFHATGHVSPEQGPRGGNLVCAGATAVIRSVARALADHPETPVRIESSGEGDLHVSMMSTEETCNDWVDGVVSVIVAGIGDLAREYPDEVRLIDERMNTDGT